MIIIMGIAGSGKSVQSTLLASNLGLQHVSIGKLLRKSHSKSFEKDLQAGKLLDDDQVNKTLKTNLEKRDQKEVILDGFPRTLNQAKWLLSMQDEGLIRINCIIHLKVAENIARNRLLARKRPDDHALAISRRFLEYKKEILPIINQFREAGIAVYEIDGSGPISDVQMAIKKVLPSRF